MILNLFKKNNDHVLHFEGFYSSSNGFEKYDQAPYCYLIQFFRDGTVKKGVPHNGGFHEVANGKYKIKANTVTFSISSIADNFTSTWKGTVHKDYIDFHIQHPDFEDIEGKYYFVQ